MRLLCFFFVFKLAFASQNDCVGSNSSQWSCVRYQSQIKVALRKKTKYGFQKHEIAGTGRKLYQTVDTGYVNHRLSIPQFSDGPGYKLTRMPEYLFIKLQNFYNYQQRHKKHHEPVGGFYMNDRDVPIKKLDLDDYPNYRNLIDQVMKPLLENWCNCNLTHTSTFGIRIYANNSMLVNHVDRAATHIISAVLQLDQQGMDKGWPIEVMHNPPKKSRVEVFMQPGDALFYEGSKFLHGRPMRMQGREFANIFLHYKPVNYVYKNNRLEL